MNIKIWEIRSSKNLKLEYIAKVAGVSKSAINNYENEKVSPTIHVLEKIAKGMDCKITDLFDSDYK